METGNRTVEDLRNEVLEIHRKPYLTPADRTRLTELFVALGGCVHGSPVAADCRACNPKPGPSEPDPSGRIGALELERDMAKRDLDRVQRRAEEAERRAESAEAERDRLLRILDQPRSWLSRLGVRHRR